MAEQMVVISGGEMVKSHCANYTVFSSTCRQLLPASSLSAAVAGAAAAPPRAWSVLQLLLALLVSAAASVIARPST